MRETYAAPLPGMNLAEMSGKLIVIEGTDGVGRSTQIRLLRPWLEQQGRAVLDTAIKRSELAGKGIQQAKEGHTLGRITLSLFYATDFADRLEHEIVPALRAGFVVLTDRYIYSLMARAIVRGADARWIRNAYGFALKPDATFYLRIGVDDLIPRVVFSRGFDYWESGMDIHPSEDMYDSFRKYQTELLTEFERLAKEYNFEVIDATPDVRTVFEHLRAGVARVLSGEPREPLFSVVAPAGESAEAATKKVLEMPGKPAAPILGGTCFRGSGFDQGCGRRRYQVGNPLLLPAAFPRSPGTSGNISLPSLTCFRGCAESVSLLPWPGASDRAEIPAAPPFRSASAPARSSRANSLNDSGVDGATPGHQRCRARRTHEKPPRDSAAAWWQCVPHG